MMRSMKMDLRAALITGIDIPFPEGQLIIHQPSLMDISRIGEKEFFTGIQLLCFNKSMLAQDELVLSNQSDFQIFMTVMSSQEARQQKNNVIDVLSLIFPNANVMFTPRALMIDNQVIDENNFEHLQFILKEVFCIKNQLSQSGGYNPADKRAKEIADKLKAAKEKIAKQKGGDDEGSIISIYASTIAVGLQLPIFQVNQYTLYQLFDQIERFGLWIAWDIDIKSRLAGATSDSYPDNWMKNIH